MRGLSRRPCHCRCPGGRLPSHCRYCSKPSGGPAGAGRKDGPARSTAPSCHRHPDRGLKLPAAPARRSRAGKRPRETMHQPATAATQTPRPAAREARQRSRQRLISERSLPSPPRENSKPTFAETSGPIDSRRRQRFHGHSILLRSLFNSLSWTRVHAPPPQVAITSRSNAAFDCHQLIELPDAWRIGRQDPLNDALTRARPPPRTLDRADAAPRPRSPRQPRRAEAAGSTTGGP